MTMIRTIREERMEKYISLIPGSIKIQEIQVCPRWDCSYQKEGLSLKLAITHLGQP